MYFGYVWYQSRNLVFLHVFWNCHLFSYFIHHFSIFSSGWKYFPQIFALGKYCKSKAKCTEGLVMEKYDADLWTVNNEYFRINKTTLPKIHILALSCQMVTYPFLNLPQD